ncbi:MAG: YihY/virulence factor BrkB family protein [Angelakisella sp.]
MRLNKIQLVERLKKRISQSRVLSLAAELVNRFYRHSVGNSAAALTYYLLFAFFPFLIFVSSLLGRLELPPISTQTLRTFIPLEILELMNSFLQHVRESTTAPLLIFGLIFAVYFPLRAVSSLMDFICLAYETREKRSLLHRGFLILIVAVGLVVAIAVSMVILVAGQPLLTFVARFLPLSLKGIQLWSTLRFLLLGGVILVLLLLLYLVAPGRVVPLRRALPGAVGSLCCWLMYTVGFSFYVEHMGNYSVVYGSIGAIIVLLLWLYATSVTIIMGAELNAALAKRR